VSSNSPPNATLEHKNSPPHWRDGLIQKVRDEGYSVEHPSQVHCPSGQVHGSQSQATSATQVQGSHSQGSHWQASSSLQVQVPSSSPHTQSSPHVQGSQVQFSLQAASSFPHVQGSHVHGSHVQASVGPVDSTRQHVDAHATPHVTTAMTTTAVMVHFIMFMIFTS
jgi:hypothetical protein